MTWLFGDRGIPASYRHMNGYGSHTFQWTNEAGEVFWVKYHFKTDQGIKNLTQAVANKLAGEDPDSHQRDLREAIERGEFPVSGQTGNAPAPSHAEDNDFVQAGNLYRLMSEDEKERLIANLAGFLAKVSREEIADRAIANFRQADEDYGKRLEAAVQALRG